MNRVHLKLWSCSLLYVRSRALSAAPPPSARWDFRFHRFFRLMASNSSNKGRMEPRQPPGKKKNKQTETMRRIKIKETRAKRGDTHGPASVYLQVVGAGSRDNPASLYVFTDYNRYLFNCGEGTQRLMQEHKLKIARLDSIFLTRMSWGNVGGLPGMILTLKDTGVPGCVLSGPPQLETFVSAMRTFSGSLDDIKLMIRPYTEDAYTDDSITIHQVPIFAKTATDSRKLSSSPPESPPSPKKDGVNSQHPSSPETARDPSLVVAFICRLHPKKGNLLVTEAKKLGLPLGKPEIGPIVKALKDGQTITYGGKEIRPEQVCTPTDPGPIFIVVECPSEDFVEAFCSNQQFQQYQTGGTEDPAAIVVHMTPESVLDSEKYKEWMGRFPSSTEHLILNENANSIHNIRCHKIQTQLNMIHPQIFPELKSYRSKRPQATLQVPNVRAECLLKFQLRPSLEWQRDAIPPCNKEEFVKEASEVPNFLQEVEAYRRICSSDDVEAKGQKEKFPEIVFLGTGSSLPMKIRNVSGTLVNLSPQQSLLLDCGEGTFSQLCRHYGDNVDETLSKISTVFISHMHADHHTGLLNLLNQRERALETLGRRHTPIYLVAPTSIMTWLNRYHWSCEELVHNLNLIPNWSLLENCEDPKPTTQTLIKGMLKMNNLEKFQTCLVHHCKSAYACSFTHHSGWKLAFSGDTMPCDAFVNIGRDATMVIHEATLEDGLEEEAIEKRHSTTSQAIDVGMRMNADFIMLNHFSQRYAKIPLFSEDFTEKVGISFDHMKVHFGDLKILPALTPALKALFAGDIEEMEERRDKRELKILRESGIELDGEEKGRAGTKRDQEEAATGSVEAKRMKSS